MRRFIALCLLLHLPLATHSAEQPFFEIKSRHALKLTCPCEFNESIPGVKEGSYGSGPTVLIIDSNVGKPFAMVNLGKEDLRLDHTAQFQYQCTVGAQFTPHWQYKGSVIEAQLTVTGPGEEACWFKGNLSLQHKNKTRTIAIKGACGC